MVDDGQRVNYSILAPLERKTHHFLPQVEEPNGIFEGEIIAEDKVFQRYFFERFHEEGRFVKDDPQSKLLVYKKRKFRGIGIVIWERHKLFYRLALGVHKYLKYDQESALPPG